MSAFVDSKDDDVFSSESEDVSLSEPTTKTMRNSISGTGLNSGAVGTRNGSIPHHPSVSPSFGSDLSLAGSMTSELGSNNNTAGTITPINSSKIGNHVSTCILSLLIHI